MVSITSISPSGSVVRLFGWHTDLAIVLGYGALLAGFFIARAGWLLLAGHAAGRLEADTMAALSSRLLDSYLHAPISLHLRHSPTELAHDVAISVERTVTQGLGALLQVVSEITVAAGLCVFLVAAAPVITLATVTVLGLLVALALKVTGGTTRSWGKTRNELSVKASRELAQSLGGLREIKILGKERAFHAVFDGMQRTLARAFRRHATVAAAPRRT